MGTREEQHRWPLPNYDFDASSAFWGSLAKDDIASAAFPHNKVSAENPTPISFPKFTFIFKNTHEMTNLQNSSAHSLPESCLTALAPPLWYALSTVLCLQLGGESLAQRLFATVSLGDVHTELASPPRSLKVGNTSSFKYVTWFQNQVPVFLLHPSVPSHDGLDCHSWLLCNFSCRSLDVYWL